MFVGKRLTSWIFISSFCGNWFNVIPLWCSVPLWCWCIPLLSWSVIPLLRCWCIPLWCSVPLRCWCIPLLSMSWSMEGGIITDWEIWAFCWINTYIYSNCSLVNNPYFKKRFFFAINIPAGYLAACCGALKATAKSVTKVT